MISDDEAQRMAKRYMDRVTEKYQKENPCPVCGSHNVHIEIDCICGADMSGSEWCDDCGWKDVTNTWDMHTKPISEKREDLILNPIRHVDGD